MEKTILIFVLYVTSCAAEPWLLFTNRQSVQVSTLEEHGTISSSSTIIRGQAYAHAVDFYYNGSLIFWSDVDENLIFRFKYDNLQESPTPIVVKGLNFTSSIAVDWIHQKLYFTSLNLKTIESCNFDGSDRQIVVSKGLELPWTVVVDPNYGYLFWTNSGHKPSIERANLGVPLENRLAIVDTDISMPVGLTLDYYGARVYWTDLDMQGIFSCDYGGHNRLELIRKEGTPMFLTYYNGIVYWTHWTSPSVFALDTRNNTKSVVVLRGVRPRGLQAFMARRQPTDIQNRPKAPTLESTIDPSIGVYLYGFSYTLTCRPDSEEIALTYLFTKNGKVLSASANNTFVISSATRSFDGEYGCMVEKLNMRSFTSNIITIEVAIKPAKPTLVSDKFPSYHGYVQGGSYSLTCKSHSDPLGLMYNFTRNGEVIASTESNTYVITNATNLDDGEYQCHVSRFMLLNSGFSNVVEIEVEVVSLRILTSPNHIDMDYTSELEVTCSLFYAADGPITYQDSLVLSKRPSRGPQRSTDLAILKAEAPKEVKDKGMVKAIFKGQMNQDGESELQVNFDYPTYDETGTYSCTVYVKDIQGTDLCFREEAIIDESARRCCTGTCRRGTGKVVTPDWSSARKVLKFKDRRYFIPKETAKDFSTAQNTCRSMGGYLVEINDQEEWAFLQKYISKSEFSGSRAVIGGRDIRREGHYVWAHSREPITFFAWSRGQPDNYNEEDCMEMRYDGWNDIPCSPIPGGRFYMCEIPF